MTKRPQPAIMPDTVRLPKTATDAEIRMITGLILLMLSVLLSLYNRRRRLAR
jgi:Ca-activated chloride channel family protein